MAYPDFPQTIESRMEYIDGIIYERSESGELRKRVLFDGLKREFTVVHILEKADKEALESFYSNNKSSNFDFTWSGDGNTYTVQFIAPLECIPISGNLYWKCIAKLGEV